MKYHKLDRYAKMNPNKIGRDILYTLGAFLVFTGASYSIHVTLGRKLGPAEYGIFGIIISLITVIELFFFKGLRDTVTKYTSEFPHKARTIKHKSLRIQLIFALVLSGMYFLLSHHLAELLRDETLLPYIRLSVLLVPLLAINSIFLGYLSGRRLFAKRAIALCLYSFGKVLAVFILVFMGYGVRGAILGYVIGIFIGMTVAGIFSREESHTSQDFPSSRLILFALPIIFFSGALNLLMNLDLMCVKVLVDDVSAAGLYTSAMMMTKVPYIIFLAFSIALLPAISESTSTRNAELTAFYIRNSLRYLLILLVPIAFFLIAVPHEIMQLVYSDLYTAAGEVLSILIVGILFLTVISVLTAIITGSGRPQVSLAIVFFLVPLDLGLNIYLIPRFALQGAAAATTLTALIGLLMSAGYVKWKFHTLMELKSFLKIVGLGLVFYFVPRLLQASGPLLLVYALGLMVLYVGLLWGLKEIKSEDLSFLKGSLHTLN